MPTLEEELRTLKGLLSGMESRHFSDVQQLREQINVLQRQFEEQQRQISGQGQSTQQLEKALIHQFNAIDGRFDELTSAIRAQFDDTNMAVTSLTVTVKSQGRDIKDIKERLDSVDQRMESGFETARQDMNSRFDTQGQVLNQILERLSKQ